ncbi:hypothetical protein AB0C71_24415 [Streptomyces anulatus]|uniref:hypothetical protein n=1 Tax=Streptomyces anulatus TaxID=1892 RepID=UPI0033C5EF4E
MTEGCPRTSRRCRPGWGQGPASRAGRRDAALDLGEFAPAGHDRTLAACGQVDIDLWHVEHKEHERNTVRPFLLWCQNVKLTRRFRLPSPPTRRAAPLSRNERLNLLGQLLTNDSLPLRSRVAAIIVLLYAQPCTRVVRLTVDDVVHENEQVRLRLGERPSPVPAPFAELLLAWIDNRDNMNTGTNHDSH